LALTFEVSRPKERNEDPKCLPVTNIACPISGDVKLFDFGLAKELDPTMKNGLTETYQLSGNTGSLRYMAPEVAKCMPYNLSADVYSFGLLLWQICSLQLPYDGMTRQDHSELVVHGSERPPLDSNWSTPLRILMKRAWEPDPSVRPGMDSIYKILRREICALRDGDDTGLEHQRRRSTFVLNRESVAKLELTNTAPKSGASESGKRNLGAGIVMSMRSLGGNTKPAKASKPAQGLTRSGSGRSLASTRSNKSARSTKTGGRYLTRTPSKTRMVQPKSSSARALVEILERKPSQQAMAA
jgi:serine/threonine protein kinase